MVAAPLIGGTFMLFVLVAIVGGLLLLRKLTRRNFARYISANGVQTRNGRKYDWADLYYLDYKKVRNARVAYGGAGLAGLVVSHMATSAAQSALYAGHEKVTIALVFANGTAVVPPLIVDQPQILTLLNTMPVQRPTRVRSDNDLRTPAMSTNTHPFKTKELSESIAQLFDLKDLH